MIWVSLHCSACGYKKTYDKPQDDPIPLHSICPKCLPQRYTYLAVEILDARDCTVTVGDGTQKFKIRDDGVLRPV